MVSTVTPAREAGGVILILQMRLLELGQLDELNQNQRRFLCLTVVSFAFSACDRVS